MVCTVVYNSGISNMHCYRGITVGIKAHYDATACIVQLYPPDLNGL